MAAAATVLGKRKRGCRHPYLSGNFAPVQQICSLTPCTFTGHIPDELLGGQYIRNGGNPVSNEDLGRDAHWFDGDGMLSGVSFTRIAGENHKAEPEFVNQYILTDVFLSTHDTPGLRRPLLPSITTLVNPVASLVHICLCIIRSLIIVLLSHLPGSKYAIRKISVANTSVVYHDGRALATCESGPPLRIILPSLETVGWFNGQKAEGESGDTDGPVLGGKGISSFMKEWTTAHPKVDLETKEMMLFHSNFVPPYVHYSIISATQERNTDWTPSQSLLNIPVPGISSAKMMHDFGVSKSYTVIMDLPLSLDPLQLIKNKPVISYDSTRPSRFGVFPRAMPSNVRWFETSACCIFHVANTWDELDIHGSVRAVSMLACRLTSASLVFNTGNMAGPPPTSQDLRTTSKPMPFFEKYYDDPVYDPGAVLVEVDADSVPNDPEEGSFAENEPSSPPNGSPVDFAEEDQCRLYYYSFSLEPSPKTEEIAHQFALSAIPFEFPSVSPVVPMSEAQYIYGCTTTSGTFGCALGRAVKIDALVKFDAKALIKKGIENPPPSVTGCVDQRTVWQVLQSSSGYSSSMIDPIQIFRPPPNMFAQEPRFVPSSSPSTEDSGFLLSYMFDESQLLSSGDAPPSAVSELWVIDAKGMKDVLARVHLPQRVPYGLHGNWFSEAQVLGQRPVERVRSMQDIEQRQRRISAVCRRLRDAVVTVIGG